MSDRDDLTLELEKIRAQLAQTASAVEEITKAIDAGEDPRMALRRLQRAVGGFNGRWMPEGLIAAAHAWKEKYGEAPKAQDWDPWKARADGNDEIVERWLAGGWPSKSLVWWHFKSWTAFMEASGFTPRTGAETFHGDGGEIEGLPEWLGWQHVHAYRKRVAISQAALARLSRVPIHRIGRIERGTDPNPGIRLLLAIATPLGVPPSALVE